MTTHAGRPAETVPAAAVNRAEPSLGSRIASRVSGGVLRVFLLLVGLFWLVPTIGLLLSSLRRPEDMSASGWWKVFSTPSQLTVDSYQKLLENSDITNSLLNTVLITVPATLLVVVIGSLAGYAFAWMDFPGRDWWFLGVVGLLVVPVQVALIPIAELFGKIGVFGSITGVVLFHVGYGLPFAVFLLRNFFAEIPRELLEAARLDGAGELRLFARVVMPWAGPPSPRWGSSSSCGCGTTCWSRWCSPTRGASPSPSRSRRRYASSATTSTYWRREPSSRW